MKKLITLPVFFTCFLFVTRAAIINVAVANNTFTPSSFTAQIGDIVRFNWVQGTHTTTSTTVPTGAAPWDQDITSSSPTYSYTITRSGNYSYECITHPLQVGSFTVSAVAPVKLIDFSAINAKSEIRITWKTLTEENADHFAVERSYDGMLFEVIGKVQANGNSVTLQEYCFYDSTFSRQHRFIYYRLLTVDRDRKYQYSKIILFKNALSTGDHFITRLYPNPAWGNDHLRLYFDSDKTGQMVITIYDQVGKLIDSKIIQANEGVNHTHFPLPALHRGMHVLTFSLHGKKESYKLQVR